MNPIPIIYGAGVIVGTVISMSIYEYTKRTNEKVEADFFGITFTCTALWPAVLAILAVRAVWEGSKYLFGLPGILLANRHNRLQAKAAERVKILAVPNNEWIETAEKAED